tara:strand:- start:2180 stop:2830 length:651 start_codon:yes stop_codon:yes gene_type:complete
VNSDRHSVTEKIDLHTDPDAVARLEAENGIRQFKTAVEIVKDHIHDPEKPFTLGTRHILLLNDEALKGIHPLAGTFRNTAVTISKSDHQPPEHYLVPDYVREVCDYVNNNWKEKGAIHLAAFVLWKLNWIHPFADGNGRTSRIIMYLVLNIKLQTILAGTPTIPEQISEDKTPYYNALEAADKAHKEGKLDLTDLENMLESMLAKQLINAVKQAAS